MKVPGWIVGPAVATVVLAVLGLDFGFFASGGGLLVAAAGAFWAGAGVAAMIDSRPPWRNALVVAMWIVVSVSGFVAWAQHQTSRGVQGGPNAPAKAGPNVYPPQDVRPLPPPR